MPFCLLDLLLLFISLKPKNILRQITGYKAGKNVKKCLYNAIYK